MVTIGGGRQGAGLMRSRMRRRYRCPVPNCDICRLCFSTRKKLVEKHKEYLGPKIFFQGKFVTLCIRKFGIKRLKLRADQLVRHFTHAQIRKAAEKLMKKKIALHF